MWTIYHLFYYYYYYNFFYFFYGGWCARVRCFLIGRHTSVELIIITVWYFVLKVMFWIKSTRLGGKRQKRNTLKHLHFYVPSPRPTNNICLRWPHLHIGTPLSTSTISLWPAPLVCREMRMWTLKAVFRSWGHDHV